jgi:Family of unknown function (DUF6151)
MKTTFDVQLSCRCAKVQGLIRDVTPNTCNHAVCLCDDCQLYGAFLGVEGLLDANGGTEITQVGHNQVQITAGREHVACVRLYNKGLHRWYAQCCRTPLANTLGPKSLFAGVVNACVKGPTNGASLIDALGPIRERVQGKFGKGELPPGTQRTVSASMMFRVVRHLLHWGTTRAYRQSTFFEANVPFVAPQVLTKGERTALKPG